MCQSVQLAGVVCLVRGENRLLALDDTIQLESEALWERYGQRRVHANVALAAKVISATSHVHKQGTSILKMATKFFTTLPLLREPSHTSSSWLGASRLPRSEPRPLSSRLHFTLSVLSLCLITRRSMLTVSLLGGERDWEIKFILNSFPLMWQLPPLFPLSHLFSPLPAAQHGVCSKAHLVYVLYTESTSFTPSRIWNFAAELACHSFTLRWIRCTCIAEKICQAWISVWEG